MECSEGACGVSPAAHVGTRLTPRRVLLLAFAISAFMGLLASSAATHDRDLDCVDFDTQRAAQDHRDAHIGDPDGLDPDYDGTACEELPCPCGSTPTSPVPPAPERREAPTSPVPGHLGSQDQAVTSNGRVVDVLDANTLKVRLAAGTIVKARLIGIDTPKRRGRGTRDDCGASDATARMKRLAFRNGIGRSVTLKSDPMQDGADLAWRLVYVDGGGVDFGRTMISSGWGKVHAVDSGFLRLSAYRAAEASAKAAQRGMWQSCGRTPSAR